MISYQIVEATEDSKEGYQPYGAAVDFWKCKAAEVILSGPAECLAGDTVLDGVEMTIEELERKGIAPTVQTLFGLTQAGIPFCKGEASLYKVTTSSGRSFVGTKKHMVLTLSGWTYLSDLSESELLLEYFPSPLGSSSESCPPEFLLGGPCLSDKPLGCQESYFAYSRQYDEQLLFYLSDGLTPVLQSSDAPEYSHVDHYQDETAYELERSHSYQSFARPSNGYFSPYPECRGYTRFRTSLRSLLPGDGLFQFDGQSQTANSLDGPFLQHGQNFYRQQFSDNRVTQSPIFSGNELLADKLPLLFQRKLLPFLSLGKSLRFALFVPASDVYSPSLDNPFLGNYIKLYYTVQLSTVSSIEYQNEGRFYDLEVPGYGHYLANGIVHHNTGKTRVALEKLDSLLWKYAGSQAVMVRKQYSDMPGSCIQTYERKVLGAWNPELNEGKGGFDQALTPVSKFGGEKPQFYDYPNGSRLWVVGLDKPGKVLSSERDFIYVNQAEELTLADWETLTTRATGRAGNAPYAQMLGDANPGPRTHWILERSNEGKLVLFHSHHEDNPTLFDPATGLITPQGKRTLETLENLTGVRLQRLRYGKWVSAEGQIYDYDPAIHLIEPREIPPTWRRFRCIDFGLKHPFVCGWFAADEDRRLYLYRQIYMTGRTVATHARQIKELSGKEPIEATICDHDAEDRLTLEENGIPNIPAKKDVLQGIGKVQDRLKKQADGKPRLFIFRDSLVEIDQSLKLDHKPYAVEQEFDSYVWATNAKEQPVKEFDHGQDMIRYMTMHLDSPDQQSGLVLQRRSKGWQPR